MRRRLPPLRTRSLTVLKDFGVNTKSAKASTRGKKRHSVQKSSYYSLVSTVLLAIMSVHGGNGIVSGLTSCSLELRVTNLLYVQFIKGHVV